MRLLAAGTFASLAALAPGAASPAAPGRDRGRYLVEQASMCVQCHSPRDADGRLIEARKLTGGVVPLPAPFPAIAWALRAPRISGFPGYSREEAVRLLTTGIARTGKPPKAPMPPFRLTREDAESIYDYLKSLDPAARPVR
jgi:mono/diheme cytochrome c family protein